MNIRSSIKEIYLSIFNIYFNGFQTNSAYKFFSTTELKSKLDNTENNSKLENIRKILYYSENPGVLCLFEFLNLCGLPKTVGSLEEESAYLIKKDVADKRIIFYNNKNIDFNQNYHYLKNKGWSNLDYLLSQGDIINDFVNDNHRVYINLGNQEGQKNLLNGLEYIQNFITKDIYTKYEQIFQCKSCNPFLTLNLKKGDFKNLKKFYEILFPNNSTKQNLAMLNMIFENLYKNLQIKIDFENKNKLKNYNTDIAILNLIAGLKQEMRKLSSSDQKLMNLFNNRLKVIQFVKSSRNVLLSFSSELFENSKKGLLNQIKDIRKNYI